MLECAKTLQETQSITSRWVARLIYCMESKQKTNEKRELGSQLSEWLWWWWITCSRYLSQLMYSRSAGSCSRWVLMYCHSALMITGRVWVWMPSSRAKRRSSLNCIGCNHTSLYTYSRSITTPWPVPSYTAWWQRHIGLNNLLKVVTQLLPQVGFESTTCWSQV